MVGGGIPASARVVTSSLRLTVRTWVCSCHAGPLGGDPQLVLCQHEHHSIFRLRAERVRSLGDGNSASAISLVG